MSKLATHHPGISISPEAVSTHRAPVSIEAELHCPLVGAVPLISPQANGTIRAGRVRRWGEGIGEGRGGERGGGRGERGEGRGERGEGRGERGEGRGERGEGRGERGEGRGERGEGERGEGRGERGEGRGERGEGTYMYIT